MNIILRILQLPVRVIRRIRRDRFFKKYPNINRGCVIGKDGIGKGCTLDGDSNIEIGNNTFIGEGSELCAYHSHFERPLDSKIKIGEHVRITARCRITCAEEVVIGDDTLLAPDVFITDHNHGMNPELEGGYSPQDISISKVCIGNGVWLGQRVCVLPGVSIGNHSIIGANSVVTKTIPSYSIAVGAPAKVVKKWNFEEKRWDNV